MQLNMLYILYTARQIDRGCSHMLEHAKPDLYIYSNTTTKYMVVVTLLFNLVILSFPNNYHVLSCMNNALSLKPLPS